MLKVWIAGASGQIGRALNDVLDPMQIEACLFYTSNWMIESLYMMNTLISFLI